LKGRDIAKINEQSYFGSDTDQQPHQIHQFRLLRRPRLSCSIFIDRQILRFNVYKGTYIIFSVYCKWESCYVYI